jgi:hypothetical protein
MQLNLLLLPLLGGFIFARFWYRTSFYFIRLEKEPLLLYSACAGFCFLALAFFLTSLGTYLFPSIPTWWSSYVPFAYSGTATLAFTLGAILWWPLNLLYRKESHKTKVVDKIIGEGGDRMELLLRKAQKQEKMISLTLKSKKVYVGYVQASVDPKGKMSSVGILPVRSGYRDEKLNLIFTKEYAVVLQELRERYKKEKEDYDNAKLRLNELENINLQGPENIKQNKEQLHGMRTRAKEEMETLTSLINDYEINVPMDEVCILSIYNDEQYKQYFESTVGLKQPMEKQSL